MKLSRFFFWTPPGFEAWRRQSRMGDPLYETKRLSWSWPPRGARIYTRALRAIYAGAPTRAARLYRLHLLWRPGDLDLRCAYGEYLLWVARDRERAIALADSVMAQGKSYQHAWDMALYVKTVGLLDLRRYPEALEGFEQTRCTGYVFALIQRLLPLGIGLDRCRERLLSDLARWGEISDPRVVDLGPEIAEAESLLARLEHARRPRLA
ncbi:MAG TPA: hypothetical protein VFO18_16200 [Methylomirabilota bacterium]|nr:hypothetical protein [Methylomirabilota bacterium]